MVNTDYQDLRVAEFKRVIDGENDTVILDVRNKIELTEGYIEGHRLLDFYGPDFFGELQALDKEETYLVYCRSGSRSGHTCKMMIQMGFKKVFNLSGGILAWNYYTGQN